MRRLALCTICLAFFGLGAQAAMAAPVWNLDIHHHQTNFPPGGTAQYWLEVDNVGETESNGQITLTVNLPSGLSLASQMESGFSPNLPVSWACTGTTTVVCKTSSKIPRHSDARNLILQVAVEPSIPEGTVLTTNAVLSGGGALQAASASEPTRISSATPGFGILPESFKMDFFEADGLTPVRRAGSHPDLLTTSFDFTSVPTTRSTGKGVPVKQEDESLRDLTVDLPPGFLGNPTAVGECSQANFTVKECPLSSQVGRIDASVYPFSGAFAVFNLTTGVFNLSHPRGSVTDLAFVVNGNPVHVKASLDAAQNYAIKTEVSNVNETLPPFNQRLTLWGVPADPSHDSERCLQFSGAGNGGDTSASCSTDLAARPFLTVPDRCEGSNTMRISEYDSWQNSGLPNSNPDVTYELPGQFTECAAPRFNPEVAIEPTGHQANTPTGLNVHIKVPQNENPNAVATPAVKSAVVTLPEGMSFSPSFADGLQSCTEAQMHLGTNQPVDCPDASRIGEVTLRTPLLPNPAEGSIYLAAQGDNPFHSLFALYLVLHDTEERGVLVKIPGRIDVNPTSGQITTTFSDTPQFPFEDLALNFRSGPRAPLVNPPTCGTQKIGVRLTSWARPNEVLDLSGSYQVSEGPGGSPCPASAAQRPFSPKLIAGTANPSAGTYSPFSFRLYREDSEQELSSVTSILPPGLVAKLADIPPCPDATLAAIPTAEGTGAAQASSPSCPAASQIGTISAGLGAGPSLNYFPGMVYLAGPYKGAPLSLAIVTPALAGPFDLGNVVVRAAIYVDPTTAQVKAVSDPFPTILDGVLLRIRDVRLRIDRPETTLNPTNCKSMSFGGQATAVGSGAQASLTAPFQVGDCASLGFKPNLSLQLSNGKRRAFPKLKAVLTYPKKGRYANIAAASVALPHSEFLEQGHIGTVCTRVQFAANQCPRASVYGYAIAKTPLFRTPLEGPVYLRSSNHKLPDMVAALKGPASQPIEVDLDGRIDSVHGGIRNTFEVVPDAPVEKFTLELKGGKKGLIVNSVNICTSAPRATGKFTAQNGAKLTLRPVLQTSCGHKAKGKKKKGAKRPLIAEAAAYALPLLFHVF